MKNRWLIQKFLEDRASFDIFSIEDALMGDLKPPDDIDMFDTPVFRIPLKGEHNFSVIITQWSILNILVQTNLNQP